jgi:hypothetical protein
VFSTEAGASGMVLEYGVRTSCCRKPFRTVLHAARVAIYTSSSSSSTHSMQGRACAAAAVLAHLEAAVWLGPPLQLDVFGSGAANACVTSCLQQLLLHTAGHWCGLV